MVYKFCLAFIQTHSLSCKFGLVGTADLPDALSIDKHICIRLKLVSWVRNKV